MLGSRRGASVSVGLAGVAVAAWLGTRRVPPPAPPSAPPPASVTDEGLDDEGEEPFDPDDPQTTSFRVPGGDPPAISCDDARRIVAQVREMLAYSPPPVRAAAFAEGVIDWLDPHGLWSAAPGTPVAGPITRRSRDLIRELEQPRGDCATARELGRSVERWVAELAQTFREHRAAGGPGVELGGAVFEAVVDGAPESRTATAFAKLLGDRVGAAERLLVPTPGAASGAPGTSVPAARTFAAAAEERFFPSLDEEAWGGVVLSAAVRAYVQLVDPHGGGRRSRKGEHLRFDPDAHPRRAWEKVAHRRGRADRVGRAGAAHGSWAARRGATAGLPCSRSRSWSWPSEFAPPTGRGRGAQGTDTPLKLTLALGGRAEPAPVVREDTHDELPAERIPYGAGAVVVFGVHEVRDDLGVQLSRGILRERTREPSPPLGIVLDLRGNGGGSTDGAVDALGLLIPGAPLFRSGRRDQASARRSPLPWRCGPARSPPSWTRTRRAQRR